MALPASVCLPMVIHVRVQQGTLVNIVRKTSMSVHRNHVSMEPVLMVLIVISAAVFLDILVIDVILISMTVKQGKLIYCVSLDILFVLLILFFIFLFLSCLSNEQGVMS